MTAAASLVARSAWLRTLLVSLTDAVVGVVREQRRSTLAVLLRARQHDIIRAMSMRQPSFGTIHVQNTVETRVRVTQASELDGCVVVKLHAHVQSCQGGTVRIRGRICR